MNRLKTIIVCLFIGALLHMGAALLIHHLFLNKAVTPEGPKIIEIKSGTSFNKIAEKLVSEGIVSSAFQLKVRARLRGDTRLIKAGEYEFTAPGTPDAVLDRLIAGDVRLHPITIPEGFNLKEIATRIEKKGFGKADTFLALVRDPALIKNLGLKADSLEGYLFPETYSFTASTSEREMIEAMVEQFRKLLSPKLTASAQKLGLNPHQLVTLASIIQKEAGNNEEMSLISAVFHNRLKRGMLLQADPTVIYGIKDYDGNITRKHLETYTPYNTYRRKGLPPGPIASPGIEALEAAANPANESYLYFVADSENSHYFSKTLKEHNRAVRRYLLRR